MASALAGCSLPQIERPTLASKAVIPAHLIAVNANELLAPRVSTATETAAPKAPSIFARSRRMLDTDRADDAHQSKCNALKATNPALANATIDREDDAVVVLSGGGAHGTFGAGFLLGLQDAHALPRDAEIVTGISTGSLQATFVFLARQPVPDDRSYSWLNPQALAAQWLPGHTGTPAPRQHSSSLEDLALAYAIHDESEIARPTVAANNIVAKGIALVKQGTWANLAPLHDRLLDLISRGTIAQVAWQGCQHRALLIGAADYDDGNGYAFDLTRLALSAFDQNGQEIHNGLETDIDVVRNAYVAAMIASSSVPVRTPPVQLRYSVIDAPGAVTREHMFIDGGAKVGVFAPEREDARTVTLLVNTGLAIAPADPKNPAVANSKWDAFSFLDRIVEDVLENQIYALSVGLVQSRIDPVRGQLHMAYLSNSNDTTHTGTVGPVPDTYSFGNPTLGNHACADWQVIDKSQPNPPQQYFPDYMACLIDYGRSRGQQPDMRWNLVVQGPHS